MANFYDKLHKLYGTKPGDGMQPKEAVAYGITGFGQNLVCTIIGSYLMAFMTDALGFDAKMHIFGTDGAMAVAYLMLFTRLFDAFNDPIMGSIVDRTRTKWGKCRPFLKWMAIPIAIMTMFCFAPIYNTTVAGFWFITIVYVVWSVVYTVADVPYWGLSTAMTNDTEIRGKMLTVSRLMCTLGAGLVTVIVPQLTSIIPRAKGYMIEVEAGKWMPKADMVLQYQDCLKWIYFISTVVIVLAAIPMFYYGFNQTRERYTTDKEPPSLGHNLRLLIKNDQLLLIVLSGILGSAKMAYMGVGGLYFVKYVLMKEGWYSLITMLVVPGGLIASVLVPWFTKKIGKRNTYIYSHLLGAAFMFLMYFIRWESPFAIAIAFLAMIIMGIPQGFGNIITYAMIGDTVEYLEYKTGERAEGICFAMQTLINKIGMAATAFIGVVAYSKAGLSADVGQVGGEQATLLWNMLILTGAISTLLTCVPLFFYRLTEKRQRELVQIIAERNAAEAAADAAADMATDCDAKIVAE